MDAVSFLTQYHKLELQILNKRADIIRKRDLAGSIGGFQMSERVQSSGSQSKIADRIIEVVALEAEIKRLEEKQNDIINVIESLEATEYDVLHKFYIQSMSLSAIGLLYDKSYSWAYKIQTAALNSVQKILNERKEN